MANATKYVDNVNGNNANTGDSEAQAYEEIEYAISEISGGGNIIYVQAAGSSYPPFLLNGLTGDTTDGPNIIEGYTTVPGARDGRPLITSSTNSEVLITANDATAAYVILRHLHLTHTAGTRGTGIATGGSSNHSGFLIFEDGIIDGCSYGINITTRPFVTVNCINSIFRNCTQSGVNVSDALLSFISSKSYNNSGNGILMGNNAGGVHILNSILAYNGGFGFYFTSAFRFFAITAYNSIFAYNGDSGIFSDPTNASSGGVSGERYFGNIFIGNGGYNIEYDETIGRVKAALLINAYNAHGTSTSGNSNKVPAGLGDITLAGDPFVDSAGGDFNLSSTVNGILLRDSNVVLADTNLYPFRQLLDELPTTTLTKFFGIRA